MSRHTRAALQFSVFLALETGAFYLLVDRIGGWAFGAFFIGPVVMPIAAHFVGWADD